MKDVCHLSSPPWMTVLEELCYELIRIGDDLLARHYLPGSNPRSAAAGCFYRAMRKLYGCEPLLQEPDRLRFVTILAALEERMLLFRNRRVFPCSLLRALRRQCLALEKLSTHGTASWGAPDVLVGTLRRPSQLDICLIHGFYHVPACQIPPQRMPIRYVAIYQSRSLFPGDCGIRFYGRVKKCTLLPRWQISEIPKESKEPYYRLEIEKWEQLEPPIRVRELPFTHLFTNLFLLQHSRETPELDLRSPEEYGYYQALQLGAQWGSGMIFQHPNGTVRLHREQLRICRRGHRRSSIPLAEFQRTPAAVFRRIMGILSQGNKTS